MPPKKQPLKSVCEQETAVVWEQSFVASADLYRRLGVTRKACKTLILKAYFYIVDKYGDVLDGTAMKALGHARENLLNKQHREKFEALYLNTNGELPAGAPCWMIMYGKIKALVDPEADEDAPQTPPKKQCDSVKRRAELSQMTGEAKRGRTKVRIWHKYQVKLDILQQ